MLARSLRIDELAIPANLARPAARDFIEMVGVRNAIETAIVGSTALNYSPAELLPVYLAQEFSPKRLFVARVDGRIVGRAVMEWSLAEGTSSSWVTAEVLPDFRGRGIGGALFDTVEAMSLQSGRETLQAEILHTATTGGRRLRSPTGFGDLPMNDPGVQFLTARGYALEQTARVSFLRLPVDDAALAQLFARATAAAGERYSLVSWTGETPRSRIDDLVVLRTRMSTDAPSAGLEVDEEPWDAARIQHHDESIQASGRVRLTVAAQDAYDGSACGVHRTFGSRRPQQASAATGHVGAGRAPRASARNADQDRESTAAERDSACAAADLHLQCRGEQAYAGCQ